MKLNAYREKQNMRYTLLDIIRGVVLISMILYHACWDLVYIFGMDFSWYEGTGAYIWQQSICWTFILLSGFCWSLGKNPLKRGIIIFSAGAIITLITCLFMPENRVVFGVLTLIGSCMILMIPVHKLIKRLTPETGFFFSFLLFILLRNINRGYLGFEKWNLIKLPGKWYRGMIAAYIGFPPIDFYSTDYFSLFPWLFLFVSGYFLYHFFQHKNIFSNKKLSIWKCDLVFFSFLGRHSLLIYMIHQPLIYLILWCIFLN